MKKVLHGFFIISLLLLTSCEAPTKANTVSKMKTLAFGTWVEITIYGLPKEQFKAVESQLNDALQQMHNNWHAWHPGELGKINSSLQHGESVALDPQMKQLIELAIAMEQTSDGLFNAAIGNLLQKWGFQRDDPFNVKQLPSEQYIKQYLVERPSTLQLKIDRNILSSTNNQVKLDFGGFAKGFGIQLIMQQLQLQGLNNVLINAGGDLMISGQAADRPWQIAITDPFTKKPLALLHLENEQAIFTSGNYERGFTIEGVNYHHILNPNTGYPATGIASATVIGNNGAWSDAAATTMLLAGTEKSFKIASAMGVKHLLLITDDGQFHMDKGMLKKLQFISTKPKQIHIHSLANN